MENHSILIGDVMMSGIDNNNLGFLRAYEADLSDSHEVVAGFLAAVFCQKYMGKYKCPDFCEPIRNGTLRNFLNVHCFAYHFPSDVYWDWGIAAFLKDDGISLDCFYSKLERAFYLLDLDRYSNAQELLASVGYYSVVQNWEEFHSAFNVGRNRLFYELFALTTCFLIHRKYPNLSSEFWGEIHHSYERSLSVLHITEYNQLEMIWRAVFESKLRPTPVSVNGSIHKVKKLYSKFYATYNQLLEDYATVKLSHLYFSRPPLNPWLTYNRSKFSNIETGISVAESLFNTGAYELKDERPLDMVNSLFYSTSNRNDSAFELCFLASHFYSAVDQDEEVLIINPSPDFISYWKNNCSDRKTTFAVPNKTISDLYNYQFSEKRFISFAEIEDSDELFDAVLIMSRDWMNVDDLIPYTCVASHALIYAVLPNAWLDGYYEDDSSVKKVLFGDRSIQEIILLDSSVTNTAPRKKCLVIMREEQPEEQHSLRIYSSIYNAETQCFCIQKESSQIDQASFVESFLSIISLKHKLENPDTETSRYKAAQIYDFSSEIKIHYSVIPGRKNRYAGMATFREILDSEQKKTRSLGKRLSERIEKGLRAVTEAAVVRQIETRIPYDERVQPYIISEIIRVYGERMTSVSLKTMWFVLRPYLLQRKGYDDALCKKMFDPEISILDQLYIETAKEEDYKRAVGMLVDEDNLTGAMPYWHQLNLLFLAIISRSYYNANPISELYSELKKTATIEQQEVRNALTKKSFTEAEIRRIHSYFAETDAKGRNLCVLDSFRLAVLIRFYTGMDLREICALTWSDFVRIPRTEHYQLCISKFVTPMGELTTDCNNAVNKFRRVPLHPFVAELILEYRRQLQVEGSKIEDEGRMPIILPKEKSKKREKVLFCKPTAVSAACKELLREVDIPEQILILPDENGQDIVTDIYKYYGDIFRSNFKYYANHICKLRRGEINYILGINAPDTFSKHYCDYLNDSVQDGMIRKLKRWDIIYDNGDLMLPKTWKHIVSERGDMQKIGSYINRNSADTILIEVSDSQNGTIDLDVVCKRGFTCDIAVYSERGEKETCE